MTSIGRACLATFLVLATVSCFEEEERPCGGCASPHPYTTTTGGPSSSLTGTADVRYDHGDTSYRCDDDARCSWSGKYIDINVALPRGWSVPDTGDAGDAGDDDASDMTDAEADASDAGADADEETADAGDAGGDADADADAEGPDAATGAPRGWGNDGRVVLVDLGATPLERSSPLIGARIVTCGDRHETLVTKEDGTFACASGNERRARVEALDGALRIETSTAGESSTKATHLTAKTASGVRITFALTATNTPYRSYTSENCY